MTISFDPITQRIKISDLPGYEDMREVPKRAPLDWRDKPLTESYGQYFVREEADYLDHAFKRLYLGSPTFRALVVTNPDVAERETLVNVFTHHAGAVRLDYDEVDLARHIMKNDETGVLALWILSHEYRHIYQRETDSTWYGAVAGHPREILALNRAMEGDSNAFAAICVFETLYTEQYPTHEIANIMTGTQLHKIMESAACLMSVSRDTLLDGWAATMAFKTYFQRWNREVLQQYDRKLLRQIAPTKDETGGDDTVPLFAGESLSERFEDMKSMPYLRDDGTLANRPRYLNDVKFADLEMLKHTGLANRLRLYAKSLPPEWQQCLPNF